MRLLCMALFSIILVCVLTVYDGGSASPLGIHCNDEDLFKSGDDDIDIDFENGSLVIENEDKDETVEITDDYRLFVKGEEIELGRSQKKLIRSYYRKYEHIVEEAAEIGVEGGKLGVEGAKIALIAVKKALKALDEDSDCDDLEEEIEREVEEKIEKRAERLEKRAEKLEEEAEELEKVHKELRREIRELDDLGWF